MHIILAIVKYQRVAATGEGIGRFAVPKHGIGVKPCNMQKNGESKLYTFIDLHQEWSKSCSIWNNKKGACRTKLLKSVTLYSFIGLAAKVILFSVKSLWLIAIVLHANV